MLINQEEKQSCNARQDICTVRWVKPNEVSWSVLVPAFILVLSISIWKILMETVGFEGIIVDLRGFIEFIGAT